MFEFGKKGDPEGTTDASAQHPARSEPSPSTSSGTRAAAGVASRRDAAVIGPSIQINGDLKGQEDLLIEGDVRGTVELRNNTLTVGSQGKVRADAFAKEIHVEGLVEGNLFASERVVIRKSAQVRGDITSPRVSLEEGARFKGSIEMDTKAVESVLGSSASAKGAAPQDGPSAAKPVAAAGGGAALKSGATG
jgi:cytoskeletal protein CcmA (bactofilin family)